MTNRATEEKLAGIPQAAIEAARAAMTEWLRYRSIYDAGVMSFHGDEVASAALVAAIPHLSPAPADSGAVAQCCMCGKKGLSTIEDSGPECELSDGRWVCSQDCYDRAVPAPSPSMGRVTVRKLEWDGDKAKTPFGCYRVEKTEDGYRAMFGHFDELAHVGFNAVDMFYGARRAAQDHAQADYEARVLSALNLPPDHGGGEGWVLVPREPTEAMNRAAMDWLMGGADLYVNEHSQVVVETSTPRDVWATMLAAAPPQESKDGR